MVELLVWDGGWTQLGIGLALAVLCWTLVRSAFASEVKGTAKVSHTLSEESEHPLLKSPAGPSLEIALDPPTALHRSNPEVPYAFENDKCYGKYLFFHKGDGKTGAAPKSSGGLDYNEYFKGKSRIWELRVQFNFKQAPDPSEDLYFGTELEDYVPLGAGAKQMLGLAVGTVKTAIGGLYHTPGDDPARTAGEVERPCFMLPLWAFDQCIETAEEEAPDLLDVHFPSYGSKRCGRMKEYAQEIDALRKGITPGRTYTFAFWGSSRFGDIINWRLLGIPMVGPINLDKFVGKPPLYGALYSLAPSDRGEKRHLQSRKQYYFRAALWSSQHRPAWRILERLVPQLGDARCADRPVAAKAAPKGMHRRFARWLGRGGGGFACCMAVREHDQSAGGRSSTASVR